MEKERCGRFYDLGWWDGCRKRLLGHSGPVLGQICKCQVVQEKFEDSSYCGKLGAYVYPSFHMQLVFFNEVSLRVLHHHCVMF